MNIIRRLILSAASLVTLALLCFCLLRFLPGGPFDEDLRLSPVVIENLRAHYGLNQSLPQQLKTFLSGLMHFDLGPSILHSGQPVTKVIALACPRTFALGALALVSSLLSGFILVVLIFWIRQSWVAQLVQLCLVSTPTLFLGPALILLLGFYWDLLPVTVNDSLVSYVLPLLVLSIRPSANIARLVITALDEAIRQPWALTAKAYGIPGNIILFKYGLRQALLPLISYLGPLTAGILSGSVLVEMIFNIQGLGTQFVESLTNRDYPLIVGLSLLYGTLLVVSQLFWDLVLYTLDPRLEKL